MVSATPLLITLEYPPQVGGVANYYWSLWQALPTPWPVADKTVLPKSWWSMIPWLYRQIRLKRYSHILVGQVLPLGTVALVIHWFTGIPYSVFTHGMDVIVPQRYPRKRWLLRRILREADHIITVSTFTQQVIQTFEPKVKKITVIHPAAYITPNLVAQPVPGLPDQFILSVGRLIERKGFDMVIQSLVQFPDLHYVIAGHGQDLARLKDLAAQYQVESRVHFLHDLTDAKIAYLYQHCLFFVMPSRQLPNGDVEGFGIVVMEANRFGKTAIGGRAGGMADAIQDGITGLLVDGTNQTELVKAIQLLLDPKYRDALAEKAKKFSETQTWEYAAKQLSAIVNSNG